MIAISFVAVIALAHIPAATVEIVAEPDPAPPLVDLTQHRIDYARDYGTLPEHSVLVKTTKAPKPNRLVVLSSPNCFHCQVMKIRVNTLKKEGYQAEYVLTEDYKGKPSLTDLEKKGYKRLPVLLWYEGPKLVNVTVGAVLYDDIIATLQKGK